MQYLVFRRLVYRITGEKKKKTYLPTYSAQIAFLLLAEAYGLAQTNASHHEVNEILFAMLQKLDNEV